VHGEVAERIGTGQGVSDQPLGPGWDPFLYSSHFM
jgi:hypothetical protein